MNLEPIPSEPDNESEATVSSDLRVVERSAAENATLANEVVESWREYVASLPLDERKATPLKELDRVNVDDLSSDTQAVLADYYDIYHAAMFAKGLVAAESRQERDAIRVMDAAALDEFEITHQSILSLRPVLEGLQNRLIKLNHRSEQSTSDHLVIDMPNQQLSHDLGYINLIETLIKKRRAQLDKESPADWRLAG